MRVVDAVAAVRPCSTALPGIGPLLGAELLAATGTDLAGFAGPDRLAAFAGLAPAPNDSGRRNGNVTASVLRRALIRNRRPSEVAPPQPIG